MNPQSFELKRPARTRQNFLLGLYGNRFPTALPSAAEFYVENDIGVSVVPPHSTRFIETVRPTDGVNSFQVSLRTIDAVKWSYSPFGNPWPALVIGKSRLPSILDGGNFVLLPRVNIGFPVKGDGTYSPNTFVNDMVDAELDSDYRFFTVYHYDLTISVPPACAFPLSVAGSPFINPYFNVGHHSISFIGQ